MQTLAREFAMRKTKEEAEITRQTLLRAGLRVFSSQGYADTRLEDIAAEAGVTRGAIYHHFGGKAELYNALVQERYGRVNQVFEQAISEGGTPVQILRRLMIRSLQYLEDDDDYRAVQELVSFKTAIIPELEAGMRQKKNGTRSFVDYVAGLIEQGLDAGEVRPGTNARDAALSAIGLINGVSLMWLFDPTLFSLRARAEGIVDTFLKGVILADR
jgi:TetR/AcrR family acrAB operon transcriptional repressor